MVSSKRIGFFWSEEKITLVEFEKNAPLQVISSPFDSKTTNSSPFSSNFTEEIQVTTLFQKMLQDYRITNAAFYVSLPMKEVILRSFVIPFVKPEEVQDAIKFEARKYLPLDIQELVFVFYKSTFLDNKVKKLQIIFFAVRKETLEKFDRIFKQVGASVAFCEPCVVSLTKMLLFKKEIKPTDHLAFLIIEKELGRIFFINQGIPQFVREFSLTIFVPSNENQDSGEALNLKILNEVGNSFDFYARQFSGERIDQMLVSAESISQELLDSLESELKLKLRKTSPVVTMGGSGQSNDMDSIYAMGACVDPAIESLAGFNFIKDPASKPRFSGDLSWILDAYKDVIMVLVICVIPLIAVNVLFSAQLKVIQHQYDQLSLKEGIYSGALLSSIQAETQANTDKLTAYKNIRVRTDVALMLLRVASHLPKGALLKELEIHYEGNDVSTVQVSINMDGMVTGDDTEQEMAVVNKVYSDLKNDKQLAKYVKTVNLVKLNSEESGNKPIAEFNIQCT